MHINLTSQAHMLLLHRLFLEYDIIFYFYTTLKTFKKNLKLSTVESLSADPGIASSISAPSHTFVEIANEIISTVTLLTSANSRRVVVSCS